MNNIFWKENNKFKEKEIKYVIFLSRFLLVCLRKATYFNIDGTFCCAISL